MVIKSYIIKENLFLEKTKVLFYRLFKFYFQGIRSNFCTVPDQKLISASEKFQ